MQQNIDAQFDSLVNETNYYKKPLTKMKNIMTTELKKAKDPEKFVRFFVKAAISKKPRNYYNVCNSKKMKLLSIIPSKLTDKILKSYFK
ncbi:MAG: hypothetical protein EOM78_22705 [Erysipelotrichia bacterium]|nr:hypothetical protein [Erysipelotrichia bacterium]